jgi:putative permease
LLLASVPTFEHKKVVSFFTVLAWLGLISFGLWLFFALRTLLPPFLVATIIAMTLTPEVDRLERQGMFGRRFPRGLAIGVIYALFLGICTLIVKGLTLVSFQMTDLINSLHFPPQLYGTPHEAADYATHWVTLHHVPIVMRLPLINQARHVPDLLGNGLKWFGDNLPGMAGNLVWVVIVPIITFFILLDFNKILGKSLLLVPKERREGLLATVTDIIAVFGSYVRGVFTVMALDICVIFAVLWGFGLRDYALTLAVTAGLLYTIPYFGALVSTVLIGLVTLATHGLASAIVIVLLMVFIHQIVFDIILAPRIIGGSVNLHPLLTLIALMAGGTLLGIGGTLLAVPVAAALQVILIRLFPQFKTDVVAVRHAANVVQRTITKDTEAAAPPSRKDDNAPALQQEQDTARAEAQAAQVLPSPSEAKDPTQDPALEVPGYSEKVTS